VDYRRYDTRGIEPLFSFGHGLSYMEFEYSNLQIEQMKDGNVCVTLDVKNVGESAGAEVVQLYIRDIEASVDRPYKELKAFVKIALLPSQTKQAELFIKRDAFAFFSQIQKRWIIEPGEFELLIGSSSIDIRLSGKMTIKHF